MAQVFYSICVNGHLDPGWSDWFGGLTITQESDGVTVIAGPVQDQAALFGLLSQVRDLGLTLISVNQIEPDTRSKITS